MAPSRGNPNKVQANASQEGIGKSNNFQIPIAQVDNGKNHFDVAKLNDLDNVEKLILLRIMWVKTPFISIQCAEL
jgi:hypothetical protein